MIRPYCQDVLVKDMLSEWQGQNKARRNELARVLGINLGWNMMRLSDGQRKKVRIMLKLMKPFRLCIIDEFTVELDIRARQRFMDYLTKECEERGAAVIFATHIFDQADDWATHITFLGEDHALSP